MTLFVLLYNEIGRETDFDDIVSQYEYIMTNILLRDKESLREKIKARNGMHYWSENID